MGATGRGLLGNRDFLKLWTGQTISQFGSQVTQLALPLVAAVTLRATPRQMGLLGAAEFAPFLLLGLFAGVWADRLPRRPLLIAADLARAALLLGIPLAAAIGALRIELVYAIALLTGVGTVFFEVLMLEAVRRHVPRDAMRLVEGAIGRRARRVMPFVIAALYGAGLGMAWRYRDMLAHPLDSSFATLLSVKIALATSVLAHFITAVTLGARGRLTSRRSRLIHISVFCHVVLIVFLAKAMFYVSW